MQKYIYFNNLKFTLDENTHYYLNSTTRKRLHRYVWEYYNGPIPKGYEIHHIDMNKENNDISNLKCLSRSEHRKLHGALLTDVERNQRRNNLNENARPKSILWHKSKEGSEWHRQHAIRVAQKNKDRIENTCIVCGTKFKSMHHCKYCSGKCKKQHERELGKYKITAVCACCGQEFKTNKYRIAKCCSKACVGKYRRMNNESKRSQKDKN